MPFLLQALGQVGADESAAAGDQDTHPDKATRSDRSPRHAAWTSPSESAF